MDDEQLSIPMPIVGVQTTLQRVPGHGWTLTQRVLRQDDGWGAGDRYRSLTTDEALDLALTLLEVIARDVG